MSDRPEIVDRIEVLLSHHGLNPVIGTQPDQDNGPPVVTDFDSGARGRHPVPIDPDQEHVETIVEVLGETHARSNRGDGQL